MPEPITVYGTWSTYQKR